MYSFLCSILFALLVTLCCHSRTVSQIPASSQSELHAGALAYNQGTFKEAADHFRKALELDPKNKYTLLFIARSIDAQWRRGDSSPENLTKIRDAMAAYQRFLAVEPNNELAFVAVA